MFQLKLFFLFVILTTTVCVPVTNNKKAAPCNSDICKLPNCRCASTDIPGGFSPSEIPQLVHLTFDDAVTVTNYPYYEEALFGKTNPDGCPIGVTYFVSHEYTDYNKIHDLHSRGYEIALHSISHYAETTYWKQINESDLINEFGGERELISKFADIPIKSLQGIRLPFLQLSGDNSFNMLQKVGLKYDCSWPTQQYIDPGLWPYTLDYASSQDCPIGPCPKSPLRGVWVVPMVDWVDPKGQYCSMVDNCQNMPTDVEGAYEFFVQNFVRHYKGNRAPFGFYVHAALFGLNPNYFEAYKKFVNYITSLPDVYIVNIQSTLDWVQNPSSLVNLKSSWSKCQPTYEPKCKTGQTCRLLKGDEERYMTICGGTCPQVYPWLGNPLGKN